MTERPILFTPENAQKVFEGTKTQTRRIVKRNASGRVKVVGSPKSWHFGDPDAVLACPYGLVGDRLWIREAWAPCDACHMEIYKGQGVRNCPHCDESASGLKFTPSIHMHRWVCRTVVELTKVWVERVQEITEEDAIAEGCEPHFPSGVDGKIYRRPFNCLWESIHGKGSWEMNPWVWVLTFKKVGS